jgi:hypothetical protein
MVGARPLFKINIPGQGTSRRVIATHFNFDNMERE